MRSLGDEPDAAWLLAAPVTTERLAAFGARSLFSDAKATLRDLPAGSNARALAELRWRARDAGRLLRLLIDEPGHPVAPAARAEVARFMSQWQELAGAVHRDFRPLLG